MSEYVYAEVRTDIGNYVGNSHIDKIAPYLSLYIYIYYSYNDSNDIMIITT